MLVRTGRAFSRCARVCIAGLAATLLFGCTRPEPPPLVETQTEEWQFGRTRGQRIVTDHFDLHTTIRDQEFLDLLPCFLESAHRRYVELIPSRSAEPQRLVTYLFAGRADWERFTRQHWPRRAPIYRRIQSGGFTEGTTSVVYYIRRPRTMSVLAHEGLHQYLAKHVPGELPAWLNEGLACYCEGFELHRGRLSFKPRNNHDRLNALREGLNANTLLPLREVLRTHAGAVIAATDRRVYSYYAQAWALILYLDNDPNGEYAVGLRRLLNELGTEQYRVGIGAYLAASEPQDGTPINQAEAAFRKYICEDLATFEKGFDAFLRDLAMFVKPSKSLASGVARPGAGRAASELAPAR